MLRGSVAEESEDEERLQPTGLLMMFAWSRLVVNPSSRVLQEFFRIPKIAGDNYRPAAWIPYKQI